MRRLEGTSPHIRIFVSNTSRVSRNLHNGTCLLFACPPSVSTPSVRMHKISLCYAAVLQASISASATPVNPNLARD